MRCALSTGLSSHERPQVQQHQEALWDDGHVVKC
jgi:hypothetical protein